MTPVGLIVGEGSIGMRYKVPIGFGNLSSDREYMRR